MAQCPILGIWRLLSCELSTGDGAVCHPLGRKAIAYLVYGAAGHVSYRVVLADRALLASDGRRDGIGDGQRAITQTYPFYCGTYELHGDTVVHYIAVSWVPELVGTTQVQTVQVSGDRLALHCAAFPEQGKLQMAHFVWQRVRENQGAVANSPHSFAQPHSTRASSVDAPLLALL